LVRDSSNSEFPSPLRGGVRGGGRDARGPVTGECCTTLRPPTLPASSDFATPTPSPSPQGGGESTPLPG
jgi:hypothetical protein